MTFCHLQKKFGDQNGKKLKDIATKTGIDDEKTAFKEFLLKNKKCPYSDLFWSECGKMWTRITLNTNNFQAVSKSKNCKSYRRFHWKEKS